MNSKTINLEYYALLQEQANKSSEELTTTSENTEELFQELVKRYKFSLSRDQIKVACNNKFVTWAHPINNKDTIIFIPPVAGG